MEQNSLQIKQGIFYDGQIFDAYVFVNDLLKSAKNEAILKQYNNLNVRISNKYHDRFLIIDKEKAYYIGASLKDLAKKVFAFSLIDVELLGKLDR